MNDYSVFDGFRSFFPLSSADCFNWISFWKVHIQTAPIVPDKSNSLSCYHCASLLDFFFCVNTRLASVNLLYDPRLHPLSQLNFQEVGIHKTKELPRSACIQLITGWWSFRWAVLSGICLTWWCRYAQLQSVQHNDLARTSSDEIFHRFSSFCKQQTLSRIRYASLKRM